MTASLDESALKARVGEILNRWPVAGLAVGVIPADPWRGSTGTASPT